MAHRRGGDVGGSPPEELLTDLFVDEPVPAADDESGGVARDAHETARDGGPQGPADAESEGPAEDDSASAAEPPPAPPTQEERLRRIESQLESLITLLRETPAGTARPGAVGEGAGTAADGASPTPPLPEALVEDLKLAKSNLAGLSERVESLERGLSEKLKPIEEAAESVRETTGTLASTGKRLERSTRGIASSLWATGHVEELLETLHRYAFWWTVAVFAVAIVAIGLAMVERHGVL